MRRQPLRPALWRPPGWAAASGMAFCVLAGLVATGHTELIAADAALSAAAYDFGERHPTVRAAAARLTHLGHGAVVLALVSGAAGTLPRHRRRRALAFATTAFAAGGLLRGAVRAWTARVRPVRPGPPVAGYAFPSGHASRAATAALVVAFLRWPELSPAGRAVLLTALAGWPLTVGASRVVLAAHWPSDVLAGWLVALTAAPVAASLTGSLPPA
ncbi:phosphatase PAP2 family protein [Micromonospora sp. NPDC003197]